MGNEVSSFFEDVGSALSSAFSEDVWSPSKNGFNDFFEHTIGGGINDLFVDDIIPWFSQAGEDLKSGFEQVGRDFETVGQQIVETFKPVADGLEYAFSADVWDPKLNGTSDFFVHTIGDNVSDLFTKDIIPWFEGDFVDFWVDDVGGAFKDLGEMWWEGAKDIYEDVLKPGYEWVRDRFGDAVGLGEDIWDTLKKIVNFIKDYWWVVLLGIVAFQFGPSLIEAYSRS